MDWKTIQNKSHLLGPYFIWSLSGTIMHLFLQFFFSLITINVFAYIYLYIFKNVVRSSLQWLVDESRDGHG